jgi:hypothetical protein
VLERLLGGPKESGVEASESSAPVAATTTGAAKPTNKEPASDATAIEQPVLGLVGATGAPEASATSEAAKEVLGGPAADAELTLATSSSPAMVVSTTAASTPKSSSTRPTVPANEAAPVATPTLSAP